nr:hypothetical protein CFP56_05516 [Quercus suber]
MFNPVSHRQGGVEASMIIHHAFQRISQSRVIARGTPKIATTTIVTNGETTPTVMDSKNSNNRKVSNNNTPTMTLPIFPAMLFDTKGQEKITVKTFFSVCNPATCSAKPTYAHQ